jgi:hypothetical protein
MKILDKMLKRHTFTTETHKVNYLKYRERQTKHSIEGKLMNMDASDAKTLEEMTKGFRKDYVK